MSKTVNRGSSIVLGGIEVGDYVTRWSVGSETGELYMAEIDVVDSERVIEIKEGDGDRARNGMRVARNDTILIKGVDISRWISQYDRIVRVGEVDKVRLYVQCDTESLSINGTTPWEQK